MPKVFALDGEATKTVNVGDTFTLTWKLDSDAKAVESLQWIFNYDATKLELVNAEMPQITSGAEINDTVAGVVKANASNIYGYAVDADNAFINLTFKALVSGTVDSTMTLDEFALVPVEEPTTEAPTTAEPTTEAPTTVEPTTEAPTTVEPTTEAPTTVEPTTEAPTTVEPTTEAPTTVEPTTEAPTTVEPTTVEPTTVEPTTVPVGDRFTIITEPGTFKNGSTEDAKFVIKDNGGEGNIADLFTGIDVDGTAISSDAFTAASGTEAGTLELTIKADYLNKLAIGDHAFKFNFGEESATSTLKVVEPDATSATEPTTIAPTTSKSTSDSATKDSGNTSNNGTVKTGSASMAVIILLVLVSATAAIYFARRRDKE